MPKITLVEDDPVTRTIISAAISTIGDVQIVSTVQEAIPHVADSDFVVTDYNLPDGRGTEVIKEAVANRVPYFLTSGDGLDLMHTHLDLAPHTIPKPVGVAALKEMTETRIGQFDTMYESGLPLVFSYSKKSKDAYAAKIMIEGAGLARVVATANDNRWMELARDLARTPAPLSILIADADSDAGAQVIEMNATELRTSYIVLCGKDRENEMNHCVYPFEGDTFLDMVDSRLARADPGARI
ncbi:hypothetical protein CMO91_02965 [Candidatus Woesearchaeota archaeon]|nr:hypothetical protein [Candidatus Woesearchaeota archaeon]|tara:strand:+ start:1307 stop:2029 length:723 start_codon:yes stop_codon:yes gene_type:complete